MNPVRTRIAPSPTGFPHIGTIYQVLFDFAFAKKNNGKFILRIEDTDRNRFVTGAEEVIYEALAWFGLNPDESPQSQGPFGPYKQSERLEIYKKYTEELINKKNAYYCFCTKERLEEMRNEQINKKLPPMYDKLCRKLTEEEIQQKLASKIPFVVRMKIPENRKISFIDIISGKIEFDSASIDDQVITKSDGYPTYHLGVVVDDHLMQITHVFRGKEWISSTPKHVLLYEYFNWEMPKHAHLPLILNSDGKGKLSKRNNHASVDYYREEGFLPEAVLNYLSNIVWNHPEGKEIYSLDEFIQLFEISELTSQGARFDLQKLLWINQHYIQNLKADELTKRLKEFYPPTPVILIRQPAEKDPKIIRLTPQNEELLLQLLPLIKDRMQTLKDFESLAGHFFNEQVINPRNDNEKEIVKDLKHSLNETIEWQKDEVLVKLKNILQKHSIRMPVLYYLLTGKEKGLPLPESLEILGKEKTIKRLADIESKSHSDIAA